MIGIGVDIVEIARFKKPSVEFLHLVLTDEELMEFYRRKKSTHFLATRYAAKEAAMKAIGKPIGFKSVEVSNDPYGRPLIEIKASNLRIKKALLSLSDESDYVVAMVVLE